MLFKGESKSDKKTFLVSQRMFATRNTQKDDTVFCAFVTQFIWMVSESFVLFCFLHIIMFTVLGVSS